MTATDFNLGLAQTEAENVSPVANLPLALLHLHFLRQPVHHPRQRHFIQPK